MRPNSPDEPEYVEDLISTSTIAALNRAARHTYDWSYNEVYFRGGFLHAYPMARFQAQQPPGSIPRVLFCTRELADALFVVYETAPNASGVHAVIRRHACLLMFKKKGARKPRTPRFNPGITAIPKQGSSEKEQFYLFNSWPDFEIVSRKKHRPALGKFNLRNHNGVALSTAALHDVGKYALVYDGNSGNAWQMDASTHPTRQACWLATNPVPNTQLIKPAGTASDSSLGHLLEHMVDNVAGAGRGFNPLAPPSPPGTVGWNELMGLLLGYHVTTGGATPSPSALLKGTSSPGRARDINPSAMQFMPAFGTVFEEYALARANFAGIGPTPSFYDVDPQALKYDGLHRALGAGTRDPTPRQPGARRFDTGADRHREPCASRGRPTAFVRMSRAT